MNAEKTTHEIDFDKLELGAESIESFSEGMSKELMQTMESHRKDLDTLVEQALTKALESHGIVTDKERKEAAKKGIVVRYSTEDKPEEFGYILSKKIPLVDVKPIKNTDKRGKLKTPIRFGYTIETHING